MKKMIPTLMFFFLMSCQSKDSKNTNYTTLPISNNQIQTRSPANIHSFIEGVDRLGHEILNSQVFNPDTCAGFIHQEAEIVYSQNSDYYVPKNNDDVLALQLKGPELVKKLFKIRLDLHQKNQQWHQENLWQGRQKQQILCGQAMRQAIRYIRFAEDFLLEWLSQQTGVVSPSNFQYVSSKVFENRFPSTLLNPNYSADILPGDILLVRGSTYVSAMIARIGDEESSFSHLALVGVDAKNQKYIVDAHIETGVTVTPLQEWLLNKNKNGMPHIARVALYRYPKSEVALKASQIMYRIAMEAIKKDRPIKYDFAMDDYDYRQSPQSDLKLFCSEVIQYAYYQATQGQLIIPNAEARSSVRKFAATDYLKSLGLNLPDQTFFAPADVEIDPRLQFVGEYRAINVKDSSGKSIVRKSRMQDAVIQSIYNWMIQNQYDFTYHYTASGKTIIAKVLRQMGFLEEKLPTYMPAESLYTTLQFEYLSQKMEVNIFAKEEVFFKKYGHSMTFKDLLAINNQYRIQDCKNQHEMFLFGPILRVFSKSDFHWFFRPKKLACY